MNRDTAITGLNNAVNEIAHMGMKTLIIEDVHIREAGRAAVLMAEANDKLLEAREILNNADLI